MAALPAEALNNAALWVACRDNFTAFKRFAWPKYTHQPHLALIDSALTQVARYVETGGREGIGYLRIEMPPRHGKTKTVSQLFPAWFFGRNPDMRIILASYGASLAVKNSRAVRAILRMTRYGALFSRTRLAEDSQQVDAWNIAGREGGLDAVGKGGALTGKGANIIITDDLVKSRAEVESEHMRNLDWDWFNDDLSTRKQPGAAHISIMTRWHNDDVHGRLEREQGDLWHKLILPALAEENDPMGRAPGEALCPAWFDRPALEATRVKLGEYSFGSLYQQQPTSKRGGLFKEANFIKLELPPTKLNADRVVRFWDLALSENTAADYTVGVRMRLSASMWIIEDVRRFQLDWDLVPDKIAEVALADGEGVRIGIESAFFQSRAVKQLLVNPKLFGFAIKGYAPEADKFTRALPFAARVGERMVAVLNRAWTRDFLDELAAFPLGAHDDQVDAASGAYLMFDHKPISSTVRSIA